MSEREQKTGRNADETPADEEVRLHVKDGRSANDEGAVDDSDDDVEAHVKSVR